MPIVERHDDLGLIESCDLTRATPVKSPKSSVFLLETCVFDLYRFRFESRYDDTSRLL